MALVSEALRRRERMLAEGAQRADAKVSLADVWQVLVDLDAKVDRLMQKVEQAQELKNLVAGSTVVRNLHGTGF